MSRKIISLLVAMVLVLSMCTCAMADSTIKVGMMGPMTGPYAQYGNGAANGARIAVEEINALGGLQFEFFAEDDQGDPELAVNAYNTVMDNGVKIILGAVTSGACMAVAEVAEEENVFVLTPSASNDLVPESGTQTFQICFTDSNQGLVSAQWVAEHRPEAKVGIIYNNAQDYSMGIRQAFVEEAANLGVEVVAESAFSDDTQADFSVQVAAMKDAGANFVFLPMYYTPAVSILTQAAASDYAPEYFGVDGMDGVLGVEGLDKSLVEGVYLLYAIDPDDTESGAPEFIAKYEATYGATPNQFAADAYDGIYVLYTLLTEAGLTADASAEEICDALVAAITEANITGLTGNMSWTADGVVTKAPIAVKIEDGKYVSAE